MIGAVGFPLLPRTRSPNPRTAVPRAENVRSGNDLQDNSGTGGKRDNSATHESQRATVSRFETGPASNRHGAQYSTAFAAQIVGQMLGRGEIDATSARVAYARADEATPSGICIDRCA